MDREAEHPAPHAGGEPSAIVPPVTVLSGERESGKTTFCRAVAARARLLGLELGGVISPAIFQAGVKTGIAVHDLRGGTSRPLAARRPRVSPGELGYSFDPAALAWADAALARATPCDLLVVDELGPMELERDAGFISALDVLRRGAFRAALVVVRPSLIGVFHVCLGRECPVITPRTVAPEAWLESIRAGALSRGGRV